LGLLEKIYIAIGSVCVAVALVFALVERVAWPQKKFLQTAITRPNEQALAKLGSLGLAKPGAWLEICKKKLIRRSNERALAKLGSLGLDKPGAWLQISNESGEPVFYGQLLAARFIDSPDFTLALRGLLLPQAFSFSAKLVALLNENFPEQKDRNGHFLVLALTAFDYMIMTNLSDKNQINELTERFASMNDASAPRILISTMRVDIALNETEKTQFDGLWSGRLTPQELNIRPA
jgi:hypothetical protein